MTLILARNRTTRALSLTLVLFLSAFAASAQSEPAPAAAEKLVKLNVIVTDRAGLLIDDVRKEDLQVLEDGVPQTITQFERDERPITVGFVIDASGSVRRILNYLIDAAKNVASRMRDGDEGFVASFVDKNNFRIKEEMTSDREYLADAVDDIYVEGGQSAVHDAIDKALKYLEENPSGGASDRRKLLVLITDGEDRASQMKDPKALLARLEGTDVQVFVLGLTKFSALQSSAGKATDLLNGIAERSGGLALFPEHAGALPDAAKEIARALHTQYTIGYASKTPRAERTVQVKWLRQNDLAKRKVLTKPTVKVK